jgi:hypothetical protein
LRTEKVSIVAFDCEFLWCFQVCDCFICGVFDVWEFFDRKFLCGFFECEKFYVYNIQWGK